MLQKLHYAKQLLLVRQLQVPFGCRSSFEQQNHFLGVEPNIASMSHSMRHDIEKGKLALKFDLFLHFYLPISIC